MSDALHKAAEALGLSEYSRHIFLCADSSEPKCAPVEATHAAWEFLKKRLKEAEADLDAKAYAHYPKLSVAEIKTLVVDDKWLAALDAAERSRARVFQDQLAAARVDVESHVPAAVLEPMRDEASDDRVRLRVDARDPEVARKFLSEK